MRRRASDNEPNISFIKIQTAFNAGLIFIVGHIYSSLEIVGLISINDNYGHGVGDKVLIETGSVMLSCSCNVDMSGRYGGEVFI